ncbi:MAG: VCBS repeat-containing protein [Planctomycetes bacterium]|nr:VCBS repeat-containing protein [Planctomycetota bacterium]
MLWPDREQNEGRVALVSKYAAALVGLCLLADRSVDALELGPPTRLQIGGEPMGEESPRILCSVVDWDRDGIDEVALLGSRILAVRSARGPSANTESLPEWRDLSVLDDTVVAIQILDVDGDRLLVVVHGDGVIAGYPIAEDRLGPPRQLLSCRALGGGNSISHAQLVDWDLDGDLDLVSLDAGGSLQLIRRVDSHWIAPSERLTTLPAGIAQPIHMQCRDISGDGFPDVLVGDAQGGVGYIPRPGGEAPWQASFKCLSLPCVDPSLLKVPGVAAQPMLGDFDGDGLNEVVTCTNSWALSSLVPPPGSSEVRFAFDVAVRRVIDFRVQQDRSLRTASKAADLSSQTAELALALEASSDYREAWIARTELMLELRRRTQPRIVVQLWSQRLLSEAPSAVVPYPYVLVQGSRATIGSILSEIAAQVGAEYRSSGVDGARLSVQMKFPKTEWRMRVANLAKGLGLRPKFEATYFSVERTP